MNWINVKDELPALDEVVICKNECDSKDHRFLILKFDGASRFYNIEQPTSTGLMFNASWYEDSIKEWSRLEE